MEFVVTIEVLPAIGVQVLVVWITRKALQSLELLKLERRDLDRIAAQIAAFFGRSGGIISTDEVAYKP